MDDFEKYVISGDISFLLLMLPPEKAETLNFSPHLFTTYFTPVERGGLSLINLQRSYTHAENPLPFHTGSLNLGMFYLSSGHLVLT